MGKTNITIKGYREKILRNRKSKGGGILIAKKDGSNINLTAVSIHESEEQLWVKVNTNIVPMAESEYPSILDTEIFGENWQKKIFFLNQNF